MADFSTLIASIEATIKQNGVQAITGQVLQDELLLMVSAINQLKQDTLEGYSFYGEALPNGATRVVTQNTFFLAGAGSYTINGNAVTISDGGISVIVYDCVNDEITTYQLFAYDANPTSGSGNAVTSGGVHNALAGKQALVPAATEGNLAEFDNAGQVRDAGLATSDLATKDGHYPDLFAGFAGNLVDTRSAGTRQGPFAFRQSGGDGVNYMRKILGRTEAFNQLVTDPNFSSTSAWEPSKGSLSVSNNIATFTKDSIEGAAIVDTPCPFINGHTYYVKARVKTSVNALVRLSIAGGTGSGWDVQKELISGTWTTINGLISSAHGPYSDFYITTNSLAENDTMQIKEIKVVDLTLMFGAGNEPATVAEFEALHPLGYYSPASKLINNAATGLESVGFNQWDEEWVNGYWSGNEFHPNASQVCPKNFIPALPNTQYYIKRSGHPGTVDAYDSNKKVIGQVAGWSTSDASFITPANTAYLMFYYDGTTYNHDICINLSWDGSRNGIYEPYWKRDIVLGLNSIPCHDESNNAVVVNGLDGVGSSQDELVVENGWGTKIIKRRGRRAYQAGDESDATLMTDGTNTDYPLATPKVLTLDNPVPALIEVDNLGTEKRLPEDTADNPQGPFECDSNYSISTANLVRKLSE